MIAMADSLYSSARARYEEGGYMADRRLQSRRSARLPSVVADVGLLLVPVPLRLHDANQYQLCQYEMRETHNSITTNTYTRIVQLLVLV